MKKRRTLLFGLGVLITLSMAVPVSAAPASIPNTSTQIVSIAEDVMDNYEWKKEPEGSENAGKWYLCDTTTGDYSLEGIYVIDGRTYYIGEDKYLKSGFWNITSNLEDDFASGLYYFNNEGENPDDGLGALMAGMWAPEKLDREDGTKVWCYLTDDGRVASKLSDVGKDGWQKPDSSNKWYYLNDDGAVDTSKNGLIQMEDGIWLNAQNGEAELATGWQKIAENTWYHLNETGVKDNNTAGKYDIEGKVYYLNAEGVAQTGYFKVGNDSYYFDAATGKATKVVQNGWQKIDNNWYWFENGKAATGWRSIGGKWYYMDPSTTCMQTGFFRATDGRLYYCDGNGAMVGSGWHLINGQWYWMNGSGAIQEGWILLNGKWYYLTPGSGMMKTGWYKDGSKWYYSDGSGAMQTGWLLQGGTWYYLSGSGAMQEGWIRLSGKWYYLTPGNGAMKTGWYKDGNTWYYSDGSGAMAANRWIGDYYLTGSGAMATSTWIGPYWVGADGKWIPNYGTAQYGAQWVLINGKWYYKLQDGSYYKNNWLKINSKWYYFEADGTMVTGWRYIGGYKYYFGSDGAMVQDLDGVIGRQSSYYITVNRAKCQVMVYAKDGANGYTIPVKTFACSVGMPSTPTPVGTFRTSQKLRWHTLMGPSYGQYCTRIVGGVLFHSVAGSNMTSHNLSAAEYNKLGSPASHGCVRLCVRDAKWIYDNCALGTTVTISDSAYSPFDKPASIKIPASQNWDPTDPNV